MGEKGSWGVKERIIFMKEKKSSFVKQAMFLSIAGILVRVIGVLYGIPLSGIIKDLGNGYYSSAYNIYSIILLVCSYSIPMAVSKIMSERRALKQYKTAQRVFICAMAYVMIVGGIGAILTFIFADRFVDVAEATIAMRVLAPTIFFSGILSVMRGYFQSKKTMVPTAISQLIEQIINAVFSVGAAYVWMQAYSDVSDEAVRAQYGAAGAAVGTGSGVAAGLIFVFVLYLMERKKDREELKQNQQPPMPYKDVVKLIFLMVTPVILSTCIYNISTVLDMKVFYKVLGWRISDTNALARLYGMYSRKYSPLSNVPIALASSMVAALVPEISVAYAKKQYKETGEKIESAMKYSMLLIIPAAAGMAVLAGPIMDLLFPKSDIIAVHLLELGAISIVFYGVSTVLNGVLQGIGKVHVPMYNAVIALIVHMIVLIPLLYLTDLKIYAVLIAVTVYSAVISYLNQRKVKKYLGYRQEWKKTFIVPILSSIVMGICARAMYELIFGMFHMFIPVIRVTIAIAMVPAVGIGVAVYFAVLWKTGYYQKEMIRIPYLGKILKKLEK